ncbi:MAG: hypothetical protein ACI9S9_001644 [Planctomycetota bacterium]|jgi:hypothetical protein
MADSLNKASSVGATGGFPNRPPSHMDARQNPGQPHDEEAPRKEPARDGFDLHGGAFLARRLLRERVLFQTRERLELQSGEFVPSFAEAVDVEPIGAFLGRLLGAQNQLAALRVKVVAQTEMRALLDAALREGVAEVMEMLAADPVDGAVGCAVVADVLSEYGRRLADLASR